MRGTTVIKLLFYFRMVTWTSIKYEQVRQLKLMQQGC